MTNAATTILGQPTRMIEVVRSFLQLDPSSQHAIAERTPPACANGIDDCIRAVCQQDYPQSYTAKHRAPFFDAVLRTRPISGTAWSTMRGAMTYHVVSELRAIFCEPPPPPLAVAAVAVVGVQQITTTRAPASACARAAMVSPESRWVIWGELVLGAAFFVLLRGVPARAISPSGAGSIAPSDGTFRRYPDA